MRPYWAQWRYKLDVIVDKEPIYFDRYPQKIQHFPGVTVYTPSNILNQSHVIAMFQVLNGIIWILISVSRYPCRYMVIFHVMFQSGAGVEVIENKHYMACRVYLPWEFVNQGRKLAKSNYCRPHVLEKYLLRWTISRQVG